MATKAGWKKATGDKALAAARDYYDNVWGSGLYPQERKRYSPDKEEAVRQLAIERYAPLIRSEFKEDNWNEAEEAMLTKEKPSSIVDWQAGVIESPRVRSQKKEFKDFQDLVKHDDPDGLGKWYGMSTRQLDKKMGTMGYNPADPVAKQAFLQKLAEHDMNFNKAKAVDEFTKSGWGITNAFLNPTAYREATNQALTDDPYDEGKVWKAHAVDQVANALIGGAGASKGTRFFGLGGEVGGPLFPNIVTQGLVQGGFEGGRQAGGWMVDNDLQPQVAPILLTGGAGMSVSPVVNKAASMAGKLRIPGAVAFGRSFKKGARGFDPLEAEKQQLKDMVINARAQEAAAAQAAAQGTPNAAWPSERAQVAKKLGLFGFGDKRVGEMTGEEILNAQKFGLPTGREYSVGDILGSGMTDKQAVDAVMAAYKKGFDLYDPLAAQNVTPALVEQEIARRTEPLIKIDGKIPKREPKKVIKGQYGPTDPELEGVVAQDLFSSKIDFNPAEYTAKTWPYGPNHWRWAANEYNNNPFLRDPNYYGPESAAAYGGMVESSLKKAAQQAADDKKVVANQVRAYNDRVNQMKSDYKLLWEQGLPKGKQGNPLVNVLGQAAGGVMGYAEPVYNISPILAGGAYKKDLSEGVKYKTEAYKEESWYKKLKKANPQAAAAFDEAMKKKQQE